MTWLSSATPLRSILSISTRCCLASRKQTWSYLPQSVSCSDTQSSTWDTLSHRMVWALIKKIKAITELLVSCNIKDVGSFVCPCSYYHRFVRGFADTARPLHQIVALDEFSWSDECASAFETLKKALTSPPVLGYPADDGTFVLDTDTSGHELGPCCLRCKTAVSMWFRTSPECWHTVSNNTVSQGESSLLLWKLWNISITTF